MQRLVVLASVLLGLATAAAAPADDLVRAETKDWVLTAPSVLVSQSDLDLVARGTQLCHDEIVSLTGHRPRTQEKFTMTWVVDGGQVASASPRGIVNHVPSDEFRVIDDVTRPFWQDRVERRVCLGPHEVTHVLTFGSGMPSWAFEGLATFTDFLYRWSNWRCCSTRPAHKFTCYEPWYEDAGQRVRYSDLSPFTGTFDSYRTAACLWFVAYEMKGLPAVRGILAGLRARPSTSTAELVLHFNRVLNADFRPVVARYGFTPDELAAGPAPRIPGCTLIGTAAAEPIGGTAGPDMICGLAGNDRLAGGDGSDILQAGAGDDFIRARDGRRDIVRGGSGEDRARVDAGLDRVVGVERVLP